MRVSVVIPTYNSGPLVVEAVESVLAQTRPAAEVIVVDDGSTDDTAERLARFGDRVRYVRQENRGVAAARNRGVAEATGDWVAFLDADDVWHPRKLAVQTALLARRPDIGMLGTQVYDWPGPHPDVMAGGHAEHVREVRLADLVVRNSLVTSTIVARADTLREAGPFDPGLHGPEDHDLWIRVAQRAKVANLSVSLAGYRLTTPGSLSKDAARMEAGMRAILNKVEAAGVFRGRPLLRRKAWGYCRSSWGYLHARAGHRAAAAKHFALSILGYPFPYPRADIRYRLGRVRMLLAVLVRGPRTVGGRPEGVPTPGAAGPNPRPRPSQRAEAVG
jgi:glycosyltransferase involved in cell wall biosynthesis